MKTIFFIITLFIYSNKSFGSTRPTQFDTCRPHFDNFIDCQYSLKNVGYWVDTIGSLVIVKSHNHDWVQDQILMYGCWYDDNFHYNQTIEPTFNCGDCEYSDSAILATHNLPNNSIVYKFYSIDNNTSTGNVLFDYRDRMDYESIFNIFPLDTPYCCDPVAPPLDCATCNCAVGKIDWIQNDFVAKPARGIYWNNNCMHTY
jgi:hypothetical protein